MLVLTTRVVEKRVWLLDGHFSQADLNNWAEHIAEGRATSIDATIKACIVDLATWPDMSEYLRRGHGMISRQSYFALQISLTETMQERPARANMMMDNYRRHTGDRRLP